MGLLWKTLVRGAYKAAGLDSPYSAKNYGPNWSKQRRKCLERDDYTCRGCGIGDEAVDRELAVHHIRPRRAFDGNCEQNALDNLVTLCPECHGRFEGRWQDVSPDEFAARAQEALE